MQFIPNANDIKKLQEQRKAERPFTPKASTCLSMQNTLSNALGARMPQNNGAQLQQPGTAEGFGRSM